MGLLDQTDNMGYAPVEIKSKHRVVLVLFFVV